jgi:hypothetical protein
MSLQIEFKMDSVENLSNLESSFQYGILEEGHIRLLQFAQSADEDVPQFQLRDVPLNQSPVPYKALSYHWGSNKLAGRIRFHGTNQWLSVTASVADIIQSILAVGDRSWYWIDAVCINQTDSEEKGHQVRMMGDVYSSAKSVLVWIARQLSQLSNEDLAVDFIDTLANTIQGLRDKELPLTYANITSSPACEFPSPSWSALAQFLKEKWFTRVWVIQEVVLASHAVISYGDRTIEWDTWVTVLFGLWEDNLWRLLWDHPPGELSPLPSGFSSTVSIHTIRQQRNSGEGIDLASALLCTYDFETSDLRDKIFGLIGMISNGQDPALDPDYHSTPETIFQRVTAYLLKQDKIAVLHIAGLGSVRNLPSLPSWVPDYSLIRRQSILGGIGGMAGFKASGDSKPAVRVIEASQIITAGGRTIGTIQPVSSPRPPSSWNRESQTLKEYREALLVWFDETKDIRNRTTPYPTGEPWPEVYWRTLVTNTAQSGSAAEPAYGRYLESFLKLHRIYVESDAPEQHLSDEMLQDAERWTRAFSTTGTRRLFTTEKGYLGLGPELIRQGDSIYLLFGATTPFIIRQAEVGDNWQIVGECYIHGLMNGEGMTQGHGDDIKLV